MKEYFLNTMELEKPVSITTTSTERKIIIGKAVAAHGDSVEIDIGRDDPVLVAFAQIVVVQIGR